MKYFTTLVFTGLFTLLSLFSISQIYNPVKWSFDQKQTGENEYEIYFNAKIEKGWHVYSQKLESEDGPIATEFIFEKGNNCELIGSVDEPTPHKEYDPNFQMELSWFKDEVTFKQKVKTSGIGAVVKGELTYMTCDDSKCLPPEYIPFEFTFGEDAAQSKESTALIDTVTEKATASADMFPNVVVNTSSEIYKPVKWSFSGTKNGDNQYELFFKATIDEHWHIYSQNVFTGDGEVDSLFMPIPTSVVFTNNSNIEFIGQLEEDKTNLLSEVDANFERKLNYYEHSATFTQKVKLNNNSTSLTGELTFMVCDTAKCLPPEYIPFTFLIDQKGVSLVEETNDDATVAAAKGDFSYHRPTIDLENPAAICGEVAETSQSIWTIFFLGFLGGLVALLTPCVFPMIPLTVSFFTKGSEDKKKGLINASLYGFFIFIVYIVLSLPFHFLEELDPNILNDISTNVYLNVGFFVIFIVFAISFFGYFEITLPSSWTTKTDSASDVGGLLGIFFMALTLALVSFSCTGPILGSLLAGSLSSDGGAMQLTAGMGGFGLALALPFALFAAFPGWLNTLPQSGGWLNSVKVVLGFVELALAVKFLSNADLVEHWGLLKIEPFLILWIATGLGLGLYLFGKIKFPHDSPIQKLSLGRKGLGILTIAFVGYLCTGFKYSEKNHGFESLTLLSGLAPPAGYSWLYPSECPLSLACFHDYEEGLAYAKANNKPIMIDFTGYACVNCRKMEEQVWNKPDIYPFIEKEYVLISLYVDDKQVLPEEEQHYYTTKQGTKKKIKRVGDKWATMQTETFANNSQPWYCLISPDEKLLAKPRGYTPNVDEYRNFLQCGLDAFNEKN